MNLKPHECSGCIEKKFSKICFIFSSLNPASNKLHQQENSVLFHQTTSKEKKKLFQVHLFAWQLLIAPRTSCSTEQNTFSTMCPSRSSRDCFHCHWVKHKLRIFLLDCVCVSGARTRQKINTSARSRKLKQNRRGGWWEGGRSTQVSPKHHPHRDTVALFMHDLSCNPSEGCGWWGLNSLPLTCSI